MTLSTTLHTQYPTDLNLGYWEAKMGVEASNSWQPQSFNMYDLNQRSSSAIRSIVGSLTSTIDVNFRNDYSSYPKLALELFQWLRGSSRYVLSSDSSSLEYWNLCWTILKPYILQQRHKWLISGILKEPNYFRCWALSAKAFDDRGSSIILRAWFQHRSHFENMTVY